MTKYLMVIAAYPDDRQSFFEEYMSPRNMEYCKIHGYKYKPFTPDMESPSGLRLSPFRGNMTWLKFKLVQDMMNNGELTYGDVLVHIDADMCLVRPEIEFPHNKDFTYAIDSGNTHCMGCYSIVINEWTQNLINLILSEERFARLNDKPSVHEAFGYVNSFWHEFREQASWYSLAGIKRHSNVPFALLPNHGWHSDRTDAVYSLEELYEHVEILPAKWNVTEFPGESDCRFNINKVEGEDVIIRHFAGGQRWRNTWFD